MKSLFSISALIFVSLMETSAQKGIDGLIQAEKKFAAYSVSNGTKEAFLKFLDSTGIVFENGKAVNGIEAWNKREKRPGVLNWRPQYAEINELGNFGYTTGPWTFQNSLNDTVVARGQYTTVWHVDKNGEWKVLVDLGVGNTPANFVTEVKKISVPKLTIDYIEHVSSLALAENKFQQLFAENKPAAYKTFLSDESILNRNGYLPAISSVDQQVLLDSTPTSVQYKMNGIGSSLREDIGYIYGTTIINSKTENYLRIWRKEKDGWKIALEVLRY
ncbi:MAG TPA: nuclear transport factor 2 family protein [Chitinophagaceae bacterium]|nr:nuclear transport factor 2 family protein [Chitinophagaceae bacterium]